MLLYGPVSRETLNKSRRLPFFRAVSSGSRFRLTVTTLMIKWLPPWRIMLTTCLWPTLTTLSWFTYKKRGTIKHQQCFINKYLYNLGMFRCSQRNKKSNVLLSRNGTVVHNSFPACCRLKTPWKGLTNYCVDVLLTGLDITFVFF